MALNSTTIYTGVRALLNDQNNALYSNTTLQPLLQLAIRELEAKVVLEDGPWLVERTATAAYTTGTAWPGTLPTDIIYPMKLEERATGSALESDWVEMTFKDPIPNEAQQIELQYWNWREEVIILLGATTNRDIRMTYKKLADNTASGGVISGILQYAEGYLTYHTAELAAITIGGNETIASAMSTYAAEKLDDLLNIISKFNQKVPIRRKRYGRKFGRLV